MRVMNMKAIKINQTKKKMEKMQSDGGAMKNFMIKIYRNMKVIEVMKNQMILNHHYEDKKK